MGTQQEEEWVDQTQKETEHAGGGGGGCVYYNRVCGSSHFHHVLYTLRMTSPAAVWYSAAVRNTILHHLFPASAEVSRDPRVHGPASEEEEDVEEED